MYYFVIREATTALIFVSLFVFNNNDLLRSINSITVTLITRQVTLWNSYTIHTSFYFIITGSKAI